MGAPESKPDVRFGVTKIVNLAQENKVLVTEIIGQLPAEGEFEVFIRIAPKNEAGCILNDCVIEW